MKDYIIAYRQKGAELLNATGERWCRGLDTQDVIDRFRATYTELIVCGVFEKVADQDRNSDEGLVILR